MQEIVTLINDYRICLKSPITLGKTSDRLIGFQVENRTRCVPERKQKCSPHDRHSTKFSQKRKHQQRIMRSLQAYKMS